MSCMLSFEAPGTSEGHLATTATSWERQLLRSEDVPVATAGCHNKLEVSMMLMGKSCIHGDCTSVFH